MNPAEADKLLPGESSRGLGSLAYGARCAPRGQGLGVRGIFEGCVRCLGVGLNASLASPAQVPQGKAVCPTP